MFKGIITSDIIDSTKMRLDEKKKLYTHIDDIINILAKEFKVIGEWYRGDSIQLKTDAAYACRVALLLRTGVRSFKTDYFDKKGVYDIRIAVGIGKINYEHDTLAQSDGEAFRLSGRALDTLKSLKRNFIIATNDNNKESLDIESQMIDNLINNTTIHQCGTLFYKLLGHKENEIAKKTGKSQSAINQHAAAANWNLLSNYVEFFENIYHDR